MLAGLIDRSCQRNTRSFDMKKIALIGLTSVLFTALPASMLLAQAPSSGSDASTQQAPAAEATPAPGPSPMPAATPAPEATPAPSPLPPADEGKSADTGDKKSAEGDKKADTKTKKKSGKMTRQQEIDHSVNSGTVPSRYRSQVPKEYQQYIPFDKR
jgi:hypothetical protein